MEQNRDQIEFVYGRFASQKQRGTDLRSHPEINYPNFTRIDAAHRRSPGDQASVRLQALIGWTVPHRILVGDFQKSHSNGRRSASISFGSSLMISDALTAPSIIWSRRLVSAEIAPLANRKRAEGSDWCYIPERRRSQTASQKFAQGKVTGTESAIHFGRLNRALRARL